MAGAVTKIMFKTPIMYSTDILSEWDIGTYPNDTITLFADHIEIQRTGDTFHHYVPIDNVLSLKRNNA